MRSYKMWKHDVHHKCALEQTKCVDRFCFCIISLTWDELFREWEFNVASRWYGVHWIIDKPGLRFVSKQRRNKDRLNRNDDEDDHGDVVNSVHYMYSVYVPVVNIIKHFQNVFTSHVLFIRVRVRHNNISGTNECHL